MPTPNPRTDTHCALLSPCPQHRCIICGHHEARHHEANDFITHKGCYQIPCSCPEWSPPAFAAQPGYVAPKLERIVCPECKTNATIFDGKPACMTQGCKMWGHALESIEAPPQGEAIRPVLTDTGIRSGSASVAPGGSQSFVEHLRRNLPEQTAVGEAPKAAMSDTTNWDLGVLVGAIRELETGVGLLVDALQRHLAIMGAAFAKRSDVVDPVAPTTHATLAGTASERVLGDSIETKNLSCPSCGCDYTVPGGSHTSECSLAPGAHYSSI